MNALATTSIANALATAAHATSDFAAVVFVDDWLTPTVQTARHTAKRRRLTRPTCLTLRNRLNAIANNQLALPRRFARPL